MSVLCMREASRINTPICASHGASIIPWLGRNAQVSEGPIPKMNNISKKAAARNESSQSELLPAAFVQPVIELNRYQLEGHSLERP